jgi:phage baseplate assembly protein W
MSSNLTRADTLTSSNDKKTEFFSDFLNSFAKTPYGNQLGRLTNEKSVNQSLKNLIMTNLGERLFQPSVGSNVYNYMFEPNLKHYLTSLEKYIENTIKINEPRVNAQEITVSENIDGHSIQIKIVYNVINNPAPITLDFLLKRVR